MDQIILHHYTKQLKAVRQRRITLVKRKKLILAALLVVYMLILFSNVSASQVSSAQVKLNIDTNVVTISGVTPYAGGEVTISILKDTNVFYMRGTKAENDGKFVFVVQMNPDLDESGTYNVFLGGAGLVSAPLEYLFINTPDNIEISTITKNIKTVSNIKFVISNIKDKCGIDFEKVFSKLSENGQTEVYTALLNREYKSGAAFRVAFDKAAMIQSFNEGNTYDGEELILKYGDMLDLDISENSNYASIKASGKETVFKAVIGKNISLSKTQDIIDEFNKGCYVALLNQVDISTREKILVYIGECNQAGYTNISMSKYNTLSDVDKGAVIKAVINAKDFKNFKALSDFEAAFKAAVDAVIKKNEDKKTDTPSSNKGGGGGSITKSVTVDDKSLQEIKKEDVKENPSEEPKFDDLEDVLWAVESINYLSKINVLNGVGEKRFEPNRFITREEFVKVLLEAFDVPKEETEKSFSDVKKDSWYYDYVMRAYAVNLVKGVDFENFGVGEEITREQLCTIVYRLMNLLSIHIDKKDSKNKFGDDDKISEFAKTAVYALYEGDVISGVGENNFNPQGSATRAETAKIVYNLLNKGGLK